MEFVKISNEFGELLYFGDDHTTAAKIQQENENSRAFILFDDEWLPAQATKNGKAIVRRYQKITDDFEPRKRTAIDGKVWWYPFNKTTNEWESFYFCHKYKLRRDCEWAIQQAKQNDV